MKIHVLSDLHIEFGKFQPEEVDADIVVLAGDIWKGDRGIRWAGTHFPPHRTLYVLGNHEFYGNEMAGVIAACRRAASDTGVHFLENNTVEIEGTRFIGAMLWSDFKFYGDGPRQQEAMRDAGSMINDFRLISMKDDGGKTRAFTPGDALALHERSRAYIADELAKPSAGKTVVVTHFLPTHGSVASKYEGDALNPYFCSDLHTLIETTQPDLWIHGHTHESCDYRIGQTRVICNPRGYYGHELNPAFLSALVVEL